MADCIALTIVAGFSVAFCGLDSLEAFLASHNQYPPSHGAGAAVGAFLLPIVATFALASALLLARVRELGAHARAAGGAAHGFATGRLAAATRAASVTVVVFGAVLRLLG